MSIENFEQFMSEIAQAMTGNWTMQDNDNTNGKAIQEEGTPYRLWIWNPYQKSKETRLEISGLFRVDGQWVGDYVRDQPKAITVSVKRGSAAIVKEIERRLLPAYKEKMTEAILKYTKAKKLETEAQEMAERLAAVIGGHKVTHRNRGEHSFTISHYHNPRIVSVDGTVNEFNKTVTLTLEHLTEEQATTVLRLFYPEDSNV